MIEINWNVDRNDQILNQLINKIRSSDISTCKSWDTTLIKYIFLKNVFNKTTNIKNKNNCI